MNEPLWKEGKDIYLRALGTNISQKQYTEYYFSIVEIFCAVKHVPLMEQLVTVFVANRDLFICDLAALSLNLKKYSYDLRMAKFIKESYSVDSCADATNSIVECLCSVSKNSKKKPNSLLLKNT